MNEDVFLVTLIKISPVSKKKNEEIFDDALRILKSRREKLFLRLMDRTKIASLNNKILSEDNPKIRCSSITSKADPHFNNSSMLEIIERGNETAILADGRSPLLSLYYTTYEGNLIITTSFRIITHVTGKNKINSLALQSLFRTGRIVPPETMIRNIKELVEKVLFRVKNNLIKTRTVSKMKFKEAPKARGLREYKKSLNEAFEELKEDKVAVLLSGGVDSSYITKILSVGNIRKIKAYTAIIEENKDSEYAGKSASEAGVDNKQVLMDEKILEHIPQIINNSEKPIIDPAAPAFLQLGREVRKSFGTVYTGLGNDFVFGVNVPPAFGGIRKLDPLSFSKKEKAAEIWLKFHSEVKYCESCLLKRERNSTVKNLIKSITPSKSEVYKRFIAIDSNKGMSYPSTQASILLSKEGLKVINPYERMDIKRSVAQLPRSLLFRQEKGEIKDKYIFRKEAEKIIPAKIAWRRKEAPVIPERKWFFDSSILQKASTAIIGFGIDKMRIIEIMKENTGIQRMIVGLAVWKTLFLAEEAETTKISKLSKFDFL